MASQEFSLTGTNQDSGTVLIGSGEIGRIRFSAFPSKTTVLLGITRNSVTTYAPVSSMAEHGDYEMNNRAVFMDCAMPGDTIFVRATTGAGETVTGIVEGVPVP